MQHSLNNLLTTKGYTIAALTVLTSDAYATAASRDKRNQGTPESPEELRPFARKRLQMEVAINSSKVAYQLKQVVSLDLSRIVSAKQTFEAIIHTIFQIMRFFLIKVKSYIHIFRSMLTNIFLKIIYAYLCIFKLALGEIERCFT
ncbi:unnamed protein product [Colletotrichum noveboracense]|uniref:Uncharacterized protein n=1 Tax=Colletotrichum noveboracense TaxID=2664923 RepID=A0A9W4S7M6_9PEZI|nr:unnamed protein product [Colletotrichum noveboracense]